MVRLAVSLDKLAVLASLSLFGAHSLLIDETIDELFAIPDATNISRTEAYLARRARFVEKDAEVSGLYHSLELTDDELELNDWFIKERNSYINYHVIQTQDFAAQQFFYEWQNREDVVDGSIFKFLHSMPKGGVLHIHSGSSGSADWIVNEGLSIEGCYIYWGDDQPDVCIGLGGQIVDCDSDVRTKNTLHHGMIQFYDPTIEGREPPNGYDFRTTSQLMSELGNDFNSTIRNLITVDGALKNYTSREAWSAFQPLFVRISGFMGYRPAFLSYLYNSFQLLADDNVQHVEIRAAMGTGDFGGLYDMDGTTYIGPDIIQAYEEALDNFINEYKYPQYSGGNFTMKIIVSTLRVLPSGVVEGDLENAFILKQAHPNTVTGFDAVAEEDTGNTTVSYLEVWETIPALEEQYQMQIPFFFHDGETDTRNNTNLIDAVLLGSHRIGHGVNAFWSPRVRRELKLRDIPLEVCPLSNQILRYVDNVEIHPGGSYIADGIPIVISSDDPGIFGYEGMTYDFWVATMAWRLDLRTLKVLAMNSLTYSTLSTDEQTYSFKIWEENWNKFVSESLQTYTRKLV
mmetsp:Transcript_21164/g.25018  ORF Transcript_21164/g.25018 Transcript_21164/m.25018 type:complete len:572 (-) Transcript_21164:39-1754(-)